MLVFVTLNVISSRADVSGQLAFKNRDSDSKVQEDAFGAVELVASSIISDQSLSVADSRQHVPWFA